jgi:hypothetical protein
MSPSGRDTVLAEIFNKGSLDFRPQAIPVREWESCVTPKLSFPSPRSYGERPGGPWGISQTVAARAWQGPPLTRRTRKSPRPFTAPLPAEEAGRGGADGRDHVGAGRRAVPAVSFIIRRLARPSLGVGKLQKMAHKRLTSLHVELKASPGFRPVPAASPMLPATMKRRLTSGFGESRRKRYVHGRWTPPRRACASMSTPTPVR